MLGVDKISGVVITGVNPGSAASEVLTSGDIIVEVNREKVANVQEFNKKTKNLRPSDDLLLLIYRGGGWRYVVVRL